MFNCDETFDTEAIGRILIGLCQCGFWGCFDEFNRLEEKILSAVSQQIQTIQLALKDQKRDIRLVGKTVSVSEDTGIFVTMNPEYAGRSNLPDNLKQLFRSVAMVKPDKNLIAQVILFSQGYKEAELLSKKIVLFFDLCQDEMSKRLHYDFGLRALKNVLASAGNLRHRYISNDPEISEQSILIQSIIETIIPKLVGNDVFLLRVALMDTFPGCKFLKDPLPELREQIDRVCAESHLRNSEAWKEKIIQLYQMQNLHHGIILVGKSGKSTCWRVLLRALEKLEGIKSNSYVFDPKALSKEDLYGRLDSTTREWTDGVFTSILRRIVNNARGESSQRHYIVFDGDVDPEWIESLNSVLDDNKLFTLPNGERLSIPDNVRILFETHDLRFATLATVSRCGMLWFSEDVLNISDYLYRYLQILYHIPLNNIAHDPMNIAYTFRDLQDSTDEQIVLTSNQNPMQGSIMHTQHFIVKFLQPMLLEDDGLVGQCAKFVQDKFHVMLFDYRQALDSLFALLNRAIADIHEHNLKHPDFPLTHEKIKQVILKEFVYALVWAFGSTLEMECRHELALLIASSGVIDDDLLPAIDNFKGTKSLLDYALNIDSGGNWVPWAKLVPKVSVETHRVNSSDVVIPTIDTLRHEDLIMSWLLAYRAFILCGPPGSGKTMILASVLRSLSDYDIVYLNFSSATSIELILKVLGQHCNINKTQDGLVMQPRQEGRKLVLFCDEINLPTKDKYGTQRVITFIRHIIEQQAFWRASDSQMIRLRDIQFVGACNPPTDAGRVALCERFLRHCPVLFVDVPEGESLKQIYRTFNSAMLNLVPYLSSYSETTTEVMVEFYQKSKKRFSTEMQQHYIYSPRDLSRWVRAMYENLKPVDSISIETYVKLLAHEALRIFSDKLVHEDERRWTDDTLDCIIGKHFPHINCDLVLARPILFTHWIDKRYVPVDRRQLYDYIENKMQVFAEEELDMKLVLFDSALDHVLRIDRVLRQPFGHLLLVGTSGVGKTVLSRFVSWMNGYTVFQGMVVAAWIFLWL